MHTLKIGHQNKKNQFPFKEFTVLNQNHAISFPF